MRHNNSTVASEAANGGRLVERLFRILTEKLLRYRRCINIILMRFLWNGMEKRFLGSKVGYLAHTNRFINLYKEIAYKY